METLKGDEWGSKDLYKTKRLNGLVNQENVHQQIQKFKYIPENTYIMQLTTTVQNTFLLSTSGCIYSWGQQTPELGRISEQYSKPEIIKLQNRIVSIASGSHHVLALDTGGMVYSWGLNNFGQLGKEPQQVNLNNQQGSRNKNECWTPEEIPQYSFSGEKICQIYAGGDSSYAVTENGLLYVWGDNRNSQLGLIGPYHKEPKLLVHSPWDRGRNEIKIVYGKDNAFYTYNMDRVKIFEKMKEDGFNVAQNELEKQQAQKQIANLTQKLQDFQQEQNDDLEKNIDKKLINSVNQEINNLNIEITNKEKFLSKLNQDMEQLDKELEEIKIQLSNINKINNQSKILGNIARREQNLIGKRDVIEQELKKQYRQMVIKDEQQKDLNIENKEKECRRLKELIQANDNIKNTLIKRENENNERSQKLKFQIQAKQVKLKKRYCKVKLFYDLAKIIQKNIKQQILTENKYDLEKLISRYYYFFQQMNESSINEIAKKSQELLGIGQILQLSNQKLEYIQNEMNGFKPSPNDDIFDLLSKIQEITQGNLIVRQRMNDYIGGLLQQVDEKNQDYLQKFTKQINTAENNLLNNNVSKNEKRITEFVQQQKQKMLQIGKQSLNTQNYIQEIQNTNSQNKSRYFCFGSWL